MLELDDLLVPISETEPCGKDLSFSPEFDAIQEARRADDPSLEQGDWITDLKYADWPGVARSCSDLLQSRSKDLRLAGWLAEANAQIDGFSGLAHGYRLVAQLCDRYWDELHPRIEDGDIEERIGNISWLLAHSAQWLRHLPLTQGPQGHFGIGDFETARSRVGAAAGDLPGLDLMEAARRDTPRDFYVQLVQAVPECESALRTLQQSIDRRLGHDGPSFTALHEQLMHLQAIVTRFARDAGVLVDGNTDDTAEAAPSAIQAPRASGDGTINTRKDALTQLRRVADFFRRTEPHSPVAYLADKAAHWGEMPLHVWLKRVIKDDVALSQIEELLDINDTRPGT